MNMHAPPTAASAGACLRAAAASLRSAVGRPGPVLPGDAAPAQVVSAALAFGLLAREVHCSASDVARLARPSILRCRDGRYCLFEGVRRGRLRLLDPQAGERLATPEAFAAEFDGVALELTRAPKFKAPPTPPPLRLTELVGWSPAFTGPLVRVVLLSVLAQVYSAVGPLYGGLLLDDVVPAQDQSLLLVLTVAFGLLALFNGGVSYLRGVAVAQFSAVVSWDVGRRLMHHLLALPLSWFQSRSAADVLQKLSSFEQVRQLLANGLGVVMVDGAVAVVSLIMLAFVAPPLAAASLALLLPYMAIRSMAVPVIKTLQGRSIQAGVADNGARMEIVRAIQSIKSMGAEGRKETAWTALFAASAEASLDTAGANSLFSAVRTTLTLLTTLVIYFLGVRMVLDGGLTVGLLVAAVTYQTQFAQRVGLVFEQYVNWRTLDVHLARIADIALAEPEAGLDAPAADVSGIRGEVRLDDVTFAYPGRPPVLKGVSLVVPAGEVLCIVGPSGTGKSTLAKVICGLYPATSGEVRLDGRPLAAWGPKTVRAALGAVLQNDEVMSGAIADNVAFGDPRPDPERIAAVLAAAGLREEIERMPQREATWIGEMGGALSGGQKQRLLLARLLYRAPRVVVLDEATSNLDVDRERSILAMLRELGVTVIMIAHRPDAIAAADRVVRLGADGMLRVDAGPGER